MPKLPNAKKPHRRKGRRQFRERRPIWDRYPPGVRPVDGRFQLRVWFGGFKNAHFHMGVYTSVREADNAGKRARAARDAGATYLEVIERLKVSGDLPQDFLPRWVSKRPDGMYSARCEWPQDTIEIGPFRTPAEAFLAMTGAMEQMPDERLPAGIRFSTSDYDPRCAKSRERG